MATLCSPRSVRVLRRWPSRAYDTESMRLMYDLRPVGSPTGSAVIELLFKTHSSVVCMMLILVPPQCIGTVIRVFSLLNS